MKGLITVASSGTLTIDGTTIEFANTYLTNDWTTLAGGAGSPDPTKIVVHPNGKLILKNCVLKGATSTPCSGPSRDWMWEGITVLGTQDALSTLSNQGVVSMIDNAQIQDAYVGIHAGSTYYNEDGRSTSTGSHGGGIVVSQHPSSSIIPHFLNCRRSVWLAPSKNASTSSAIFLNTNFLCDQAMKDANFNDPEGSGEGMGPAFMAGSWNRDKMVFATCSFRSTGSYAYNLRGTGIETFDAAYFVSGSLFEQLTKGIYATYGLGVTDAVQVSNSIFTEVRKGAHIVSGSLHRFTGSDFEYIPESLLDDDNYGIRFEGAGNLTVSDDNTFSSDFTNTYGIIVKDSYSKGSEFFDNTFTNLGYGVQTEQNNTGLQMRCNGYTDNETAWSINPESITGATGMFSDQGICGSGFRQAGNLFNDPDCPGSGNQERHIRSKVDFDYSARSATGINANEIPTCISSGGGNGEVDLDLCLGTANINTNSCAPLCETCLPTTDPWKDQVLGNKEISMLLDSNEIEDALALIELLYPDDPGYYIGALINAGMYDEAEEKLEEWEDDPEKPDPFRAFLVYVLDLYGKGDSFMDLSKEDLETLEAMAIDADKSPAQYYIQSIIAFVTGIEYERAIEKWEEPEERPGGKKESSLPPVFADELEIQPNPATETVSVRWRRDSNNTSGSLELWNISGHLLQRISINSVEGTEQVNIGHLPSGIYLFRIQGTGYSNIQKFVVE